MEPTQEPARGAESEPVSLAPLTSPLVVADPARPTRRRRRVIGWTAGCLAVILAAAGVVAGLRPDRPQASPVPVASSTPSAAAAPGTALARHIAITTVLSARSKAVLAHDKQAFLAGIDPGATGFRAQQSAVFARLVKVPFDDWSYEFASEGAQLSAAHKAALPRGSWVARVLLHYTLAGADVPVEQEQMFTLVPRGKVWLLAGDAEGPGSGKDIWDLGPIRVVKGTSSLVIGASSATDLRRYARDGDRALRDEANVWKATWSRRPIIIVPRTQRDLATITGESPRGFSQIAAVATGFRVIIVNPSAYHQLGDLGRRVVMAHELTHVATAASTHHQVPIWMSEGFADYVAYRAVKLPTTLVAQEVFRQVRAHGAPRALPGDVQFDKTNGDLSPAYEGAWLACRMIAATYGEKKLIELYLAFGDRARALPENDIKAVLGISEQHLVRDWRAYLKAQARA